MQSEDKTTTCKQPNNYLSFYRGKTQPINRGKQQPTNNYEPTTPDPQGNRWRITPTAMGKETDSQFVREGKMTLPKHITVNEIPTMIPRWNDRTLRNLTMVEEDTKLYMNQGKN